MSVFIFPIFQQGKQGQKSMKMSWKKIWKDLGACSGILWFWTY